MGKVGKKMTEMGKVLSRGEKEMGNVRVWLQCGVAQKKGVFGDRQEMGKVVIRLSA